MPCILKDDMKKLHNAIKEKGGLRAMRELNADARIKFFAEFIDMPGHTETAEWFNREMERRLFIPNQIQATKDWIKRLEKKGGPISQKKAIIDRISAKKDVMSPKASRKYMESVAKQVMGFEIDRDDSKKLFDLATSINQLKKKLLSVKPDYYDLKTADLEKLDPETQKVRYELGDKILEFQDEYERIALKAQDAVLARSGRVKKIVSGLSTFGGNLKSLKATGDVSATFRQLLNTAFVSPKAWRGAAGAGLRAFAATPQGVKTILSDLLTRPNALAGRYNEFGIEVGIKEEAFPESWVSKKIEKYASRLNLLRRSDAAMNIAMQTARANLFDWMWERSNGDDKLLKAQKVGAAINTITGRGKVPILVSKDEIQNKLMNNMLFAPKWLASRIETLLDLRLALMGKGLGNTPKDIRARAAVGNVIGLSFLTALVKAIAWGLDDEDERDWWEFLEQTFDPRSTEFGKIKIGSTRFDISTGTAGLITLFSRLLSGKTVTSSGIKDDVERWEVIGNFISGKGSPSVRFGKELLENIGWLLGKGEQPEHFDHTKFEWNTAGEWAKNISEWFLPIMVSSIYETLRESPLVLDNADWGDTSAAAVGILADIVGVSANTWNAADKDMGKSDKAIKAEQRIAWATNSKTISSKLGSNTVVMRDAPEDKAEEYQEEFAERLGRAEDRLIASDAFNKASLEERGYMLKELRKNMYNQFKVDKGFAKKPKTKKSKKSVAKKPEKK